jgi:predicted NBD/HSP70 family sugar kinase
MRGPQGEAGEAGHTTVVVDGLDCVCGLKGCWETIASIRWLRAEARRRKLKSAASLDVRKLTALASDDASAHDLLASYAGNIAVGLANLTQLLTPGLFILHGDAVGGGETFRALIEEATRARVFAHVRDKVSVVQSELDQQATVLGAAGLVLSETFHLAI